MLKTALVRDTPVPNSLPGPPSVEHGSSVAEIGDAAEQSCIYICNIHI